VLAALAASLQAAPGTGPWLVAFSGGLDSTVLLHALVAVAGPQRVRAVHVHHGLQAAAQAWPAHCVAQAQAWDVDCTVVALPPAQPAGQGLEAWARRARYQALAEQAQQLGASAVLTAHHADDQAETVLLRLARGAGVRGLSGMPAARPLAGGAVMLLRPLLALSRAQLLAYAQQHGLRWVEDPSNANLHHARNRMRLQVMPALTQIAPGAAANLLRAAGHLAQAAALLDEVATTDLAAARDALDWGQVPPALGRLLAASLGGALHRGPLQALSVARQQLALRAWIGSLGQLPPAQAVLHEACRQLISAQAASGEVALADVTLRRLRDWVWAERRAGLPQPLPWPMQARWQGESCLALPDGCLRVEPWAGPGALPAALLREQTIAVQALPASTRVRLRPGGVSRSLKHWHQAQGVPVWLRAALPGVLVGERLVFVAGLGQHHARADAAPACAPGDAGLRLRWQAPPGDPRHALCAEPPPEGHPV